MRTSCFRVLLQISAVNEISIKFLTRPLFRCLFLPPMPASVLLKVANGPQGLGRDYARLRMRMRTRGRKSEVEDCEEKFEVIFSSAQSLYWILTKAKFQ